MQIPSNPQAQDINQPQKVGNQTSGTNTQEQKQNLAQTQTAHTTSQTQNANLEAQLKQTLLNFLHNLASHTQSKTEILDMLKSTNLFKDFSNASSLLKSLLSQIQTNPALQKFQTPLQNFILNIENLSAENLKQNIANSGVFLESKLFQNQKHDITTDMKALLLNIKQELEVNPNSDKELLRQVDKMLIQIDYYQLLSLASNSQMVYLPFDWDMLDEGDLSFYKDEEEFVCNIDLSLKDFGKLKVSLRLIENKNLNISFFIEDEELKELLRQNFHTLKLNLLKQGLSVSNLSLKELEDTKAKINPYAQSSNLSINLDIRA